MTRFSEQHRLEDRPRRNLSHIASPRPDGRLVVADTTDPELAIAMTKAELFRMRMEPVWDDCRQLDDLVNGCVFPPAGEPR